MTLPRVVPVETHWLGLVPICRPPKSAIKSFRVAHRSWTVCWPFHISSRTSLPAHGAKFNFGLEGSASPRSGWKLDDNWFVMR